MSVGPGDQRGPHPTAQRHDIEQDRQRASAAAGLEEEVHQGVRIPVGRGFAGRIAGEALSGPSVAGGLPVRTAGRQPEGRRSHGR